MRSVSRGHRHKYCKERVAMKLSVYAPMFPMNCCGLRVCLVFSVFWLIVFGTDKRGNSFVCNFCAT